MAWRFDPEAAEVAALERLAPVDGLQVLELGCGDGRLTYRYVSRAASVLAIDPALRRSRRARRGGGQPALRQPSVERPIVERRIGRLRRRS